MKHMFMVLLLLAASGAAAQELKNDQFSVSLGYMFEGEIYVWEADFYGSVGETLLVRAEYDHYFSSMGSRFGLGAFYTFGVPWYTIYEETSQHEIGAVVKLRLRAGDNMLIKPGLYLGYRAYGNDAGEGLGINGSVQLEYQLEKVKPFLDLGIMSQPAGGNDFSDLTYSPTFQLLLGVTF